MASSSSSNTGPPPKSPPRSSRGSRNASISSVASGQAHRPTVPSGLRQTHVPSPSPESRRNPLREPTTVGLGVEDAGILPAGGAELASPHSEPEEPEDGIEEPPVPPTATERTRLLDERLKKIQGQPFQFPTTHNCGEENCNHGTFSPRPRYKPGYGSFASTYATPAGHSSDVRSDRSLEFGGPPAPNGGHSNSASIDGVLGEASKRSMTSWLARQHGVRDNVYMYLAYYFPFMRWITQYRWAFLEGDLTAALTMASFYIPMALSLASNLAHVPPINGLYAFVFNPLVYAMLGTCPMMVVGPEAAGSLLTGSVVKESIKAGTHGEHQGLKHAQVAGMVTGLAGAIILIAGICRLGFLDGVLSRPFLRGFISAIGITILVDQLIPEMGLDTAASHSQAAKHGSSLDKIMFLFRHGHEAHRLTCAVAFSTIAIVLVLREMKRRLQPRMHWVAYIPDRFLVVVLSAVMAWGFGWEDQGLHVMGDIRSRGTPFKVHFPFDESNFKHVNDAFSTAFIIALLGFFESSVAAKSLGNINSRPKKKIDKNGEEYEELDGIRGINLSTNRELVALGVANLIGGLFMAIPAFGGYGRSKVNHSTGGKTPMSSVFLALITLICVLFLLPYFYFIPVSPSHAPQSCLNTSDPRTESHPLSPHLRRRHLPHRRSAPRHPLLPHHRRLLRAPPHAPHLHHHLPLEPQNRHRRRHRPLPPPRSTAFYAPSHTNFGPRAGHQGL